MNNATIKFYRELKLAVNTLLYAVYQKTHEKILDFLKISLPFYLKVVKITRGTSLCNTKLSSNGYLYH